MNNTITVIEHRADGTVVETQMEMTQELTKAWKDVQEAASEVSWCQCSPENQVPEYWEEGDGCHGWDCGRCGNLIQVG